MRLAHGDYIQFLDADDVLLPGAGSHLVQAIQSLPEHAIPYGQVLSTENRKPLLAPTAEFVGERVRKLWSGGCQIGGLVCFRGSVGESSEAYSGSETKSSRSCPADVLATRNEWAGVGFRISGP